MPSLISVPVLAALFLLAFVTSGNAHGGDPCVLQVCIGPLGVMRAVAPDESCPRHQLAVHLGSGSALLEASYMTDVWLSADVQ